MFKYVIPALIAVALCMPATTHAQDLYKCEFRTDGTRGWISSWAWVHIDDGKTHVIDGVIRSELDGALLVSPGAPKNSGQPYTWTVKLKSLNQQSFNAKYTLTLLPEKKNKSSMAMVLNNSRTQREFTRGTCTAQSPISKARFLSWAKEEAASAKN